MATDNDRVALIKPDALHRSKDWPGTYPGTRKSIHTGPCPARYGWGECNCWAVEPEEEFRQIPEMTDGND